MSTYRERREARADQLDVWAEKREARAGAAYERSSAIADRIPFGQPILVGHHSERGHRADIRRIDNAMRDSVESSKMAESMSSRAENIRAAAKHAIYSDDPDAIEALTAKLERLEAQREERKAQNATYRREHKAELKAMTAYDRHCAVPWPSYSLQNLGGVITNTRKRIEHLKREAVQGPTDRLITARRDGTCEDCGATLTRGDLIRYNRQQGARCATCPEEQTA